MAIKKTSKEEILQESIKLFKIKGYYNCSMANIADACGLIKGSIYHYFKSKDEIGIESLKYIHNYFVENIFSIAYKKDLSDLEKIKLFVKKIDEYFLNSKGGCLLGNLALEVSSENSEFKEVIKEYFSAWEDALTKILENKYGTNQAKNISKEYVSLTQGTIMMMNLYDTPSGYLKVGEKLISLI
ncbi:MAG TPA: TetR/AcrR family transcriptional regulator [Aliarcobacter thereius]|uniref:TetR/AcrR family transcriptional regulator n=1 Tax=Aliarcobacter thereius TaxID=544718 RepID=UPI0010FEF167|nr:TetR/AcrR family transcriptional regulator [Aliarcobacter thereius]TLT08662.1 TetR/AcrR family transcriptional regulator [Aliarcobacter thereius]HJE02354.1 TetR/AcrR family transcriptional regulator [Aliarcobacter thereius]